MHHFSVNWWSSNGQPSPQTSSPNNTSNVESLKQLYHVPNSLGLQISDDSSVQSLGPPHHEIGGIWQSSQDHCFSTEPSQNESHGKDVEPQVKPVLSLSKPDLGYNPPTVDYAPSMDHFPYHCVDPCFGGLFPGYWPQALVPVNSQMVGIPPARVPLPADVSENGPIYVNAKQYHGILRRRQFRAKLEAENKLIKNRKPYLHESRHIHALNRVRGSGGRFISTKKVQPDSAPTTGSQRAADSIHMHMDRRSMLNSGNNYAGSKDFVMQNATCLEMGNIPKSDAMFQHPDGRFSSISSSHSGGVLQCSGGQMRSATHQSASVVQ